MGQKATNYVYAIAGLILAYILLSRRSKIPGAIRTFQEYFDTVWSALVKPDKGVINGN